MRVCTRATLPHADVCRTPRHAVPTEPVYGVHMYGRVQGGSGGRLGAMLICMRRHDGRHRSSGGCATNGTEGSEGKHRSLSPVHPRHPPPARLSRPSRPSRFSPRSPTRAATRSPHVLRLSLSLSLSFSICTLSTTLRPRRFSSLPFLYPSRCYLSLLLRLCRSLFSRPFRRSRSRVANPTPTISSVTPKTRKQRTVLSLFPFPSHPSFPSLSSLFAHRRPNTARRFSIVEISAAERPFDRGRASFDRRDGHGGEESRCDTSTATLNGGKKRSGSRLFTYAVEDEFEGVERVGRERRM